MILGLAVCAVLAGARSFTTIAEWAADANTETLARLGVTGAGPSESTFRRTLQRLDAGAFDDLAGRRAQSRTAPRPNRVSLQPDGAPAAQAQEDARHCGNECVCPFQSGLYMIWRPTYPRAG